jgi:hypothetical protein
MPFVKGMKKVGGRKRGTPNKKSRKEVVTKTAAEQIVERIVRKALRGSIEHEKLFLRFLRPRLQTFLGPIPFVVPRDAEEARAAILSLAGQLASAKLSLELHDALVNDLRVYLGAVAVDKLGLTGQKFVVVENNSGYDLPLPADDASLATPVGEAPVAAPSAVEAAVEALDVAPEPFQNVLPFVPPDAA